MPVWRYEAGSVHAREASAHALPAEHGAHHLPAALRKRNAAARAAPGGALPAARRRRSAPPSPADTCSPWPKTSTKSTAAASFRRCACSSTAAPAPSRSTASETSTILYWTEQNRGYESQGTLWSPGYFRVDLTEGEQATLIASTEAWETMRALTPEEAYSAELDRRRHAARPRRTEGGGGRGRRTGAGRRPVHHHARRPRGGRRARPRRRRRSPHRHRRLPLVHRLGPRHDDQPRRADAHHRPLPRGRLDPAHLRPLHPRRPDPQHVPRGRERRASTTPPTPRSGSSTPSTATWPSPATAAPCGCCCRGCSTSSSTTCAARASASASTRATACCTQGAAGYQLTWMDAKVGDWVVTPRRGKAVEINALWYNALRLLEGWLREEGQEREALRYRRARPRARASPSTGASGTRRAATCTTWWTAKTATIPPAAPTRCSPSRSPTPCSTNRCWRPVLEVVSAAPAHARRAALARARQPGLQGEVLRRPARPRRGLPPGHGLGLADRPVHRRLAEGPPRRSPPARARSWKASCPTSTRPASARSARSSTPSRPTPRAAASRRPGAWPKCCAAGQRPRNRKRAAARAAARWLAASSIEALRRRCQ